jgi:hypothetical protein
MLLLLRSTREQWALLVGMAVGVAFTSYYYHMVLLSSTSGRKEGALDLLGLDRDEVREKREGNRDG